MAVISIEEYYYIVDRGCTKYFEELVNGFKASLSIHIPIYSVMDFPIQCNIEVGAFGVFLGLVQNYG